MKKILAFLMTIVILFKSLGSFFTLLDSYVTIFYVALLLLTISYCLLTTNKKIIVEPVFIIFLLYLFINVIVLQPPAVFNSFGRLSFFVILMLVATPLLKSDSFDNYRLFLFDFISNLLIVLSVICFVCYFLGINWFVSNGNLLEDFYEIGGHFAGVLNQSMLLGEYSGLASVVCLTRFIRNKNKIWLGILIICLGALFFSASRAALLATVGAIIVVLKVFYGNTRKLVTRLAVISGILIILFPLWSFLLSGMLYKQNERIDIANDGGRFGSRTEMFETRIAESASSPILGVGFASSSNVHELHEGGNLEPGSSWLFMLSSTGVIGFFFVALLFERGIRRQKCCQGERSLVYIGFLTFFIVHMIFEGYVYSANNPVCLLLWLTIGLSIEET